MRTGRTGHPRRLPLRPGRHVGAASCRVDGDDDRRRSRRVGRHPRPLVGHPARRRGRAAGPQRRRAARRLLVAVRAAALRRLRHRDHRARRRPTATARSTTPVRVWRRRATSSSSAGPRSTSTTGRAPAIPSGATIQLHRRATASRSTLEVETLGLRRPPRRRRLRRRPRLGPRAVAGPRLGRGRRSTTSTIPPSPAGCPFGVIDHVGRADVRRRRGLGPVRARHLRPPRPVSGFADWGSTGSLIGEPLGHGVPQRDRQRSSSLLS